MYLAFNLMASVVPHHLLWLPEPWCQRALSAEVFGSRQQMARVKSEDSFCYDSDARETQTSWGGPLESVDLTAMRIRKNWEKVLEMQTCGVWEVWKQLLPWSKSSCSVLQTLRDGHWEHGIERSRAQSLLLWRLPQNELNLWERGILEHIPILYVLWVLWE